MPAGNFMSKKSWHTGKLSNQEAVWLAEKKAAEEAKKVAELEKQIKDEREIMELRMQAAQGGKIKMVDTTMDWMYAGPAASQAGGAEDAAKKQEKEDFLLGKKLELPKEQSGASKSALASSSSTSIPGGMPTGSGTAKGSSSAQNFLSGKSDAYVKNDNFARMHEDPMLMIKRREKESRDEVLGNPLQMARIRAKIEQEQKEAGTWRRLKKDKKDKKEARKKEKKEKKEARKREKREKREKKYSGHKRRRDRSTSESSTSSGDSISRPPKVPMHDISVSAAPTVAITATSSRDNSGGGSGSYGLVKKSSHMVRTEMEQGTSSSKSTSLGPSEELLARRRAEAEEQHERQRALQEEARERARRLTPQDRSALINAMASDATKNDELRTHRVSAGGDKNAFLDEHQGDGSTSSRSNEQPVFLEEMRNEAHRMEGREFLRRQRR